MEITESARKHYSEHGITTSDVEHVVHNPIPLLQVVVVPADDPQRVI